MKTIAFFNNKGGVGKTSLVYHLAWMFSELGKKVIAADLDPQANLTSICLDEERVAKLWEEKPRSTIVRAINNLKRGRGDIEIFPIERISSHFALAAGDLELSLFEDQLSDTWHRCLAGDERGFLVTSAFARLVDGLGSSFNAELALIDVGPNLGAINRAALIAADFVIIPAAPDLFSVQGLENVGPTLKSWREDWDDRKQRAPADLDFLLPIGRMQPIGYIISRHSVRNSRQVKAYRKWLDRIPSVYREKVERKSENAPDIDNDPNCLAQLKDYRSLMPLAQEARKPMFFLKPADGAIGGHQGAVSQCYSDFKDLAEIIINKINQA
jgi:chromosome partitioning protein